MASPAGATLVFEQSRDQESCPLPPLPGSEPVQIGAWSGQIAEREKPFQRVVLVWTIGDVALRIDAGELPRAEVLKVAESVRPFGGNQ
jgi:hypothetical protein